MKADDPRLSLELRLSSWRNIFRVLHRVGLGETPDDFIATYGLENKDFYTPGGFWAQIQTLEQQLDELLERKADARMGPLPVGHPAVGEICRLCGKGLLVGQVPAFLVLKPADKENAAKATAGRVYTAECALVHETCSRGKTVLGPAHE